MRSDAFRRAAESKDLSPERLEELIDPDVTFRSPAVFKPYEGRDSVGMVLAAVVQVFRDFRYTDQLEDGDTAILVFEAKVGEREVTGVDMLRFGDDGKITELTVFIRPLSGLNALVEEMGRMLERAGAEVPAQGAPKL